MLDQVVAFVQEVMVGLKVSLAVELRYQCKVHNGKVPSAQPATSRSAAGTLEGKGLFQDHRRSRFGLSTLPMRKWGNWAVNWPGCEKESLKCTDGHVAWMCNSHIQIHIYIYLLYHTLLILY